MKKAYSSEELYPIYFTKEELMSVEDALYDKSNLLSIIARQRTVAGDSIASSRATAKSILFERLAGRVGFPLDELYKNEYARANEKQTNMKTIKENA